MHTQLNKDTSSQLSQTGGGEHWKDKKKKKKTKSRTKTKKDKNFPYSTPLICQIPGVGQATPGVRNRSLSTALE